MSGHAEPVPPDDPSRTLTVARADQDQSLPPPGGGPPLPRDGAAQAAFVAQAGALAADFKTDLLPPPGAGRGRD
jgi:hypothetical protein